MVTLRAAGVVVQVHSQLILSQSYTRSVYFSRAPVTFSFPHKQTCIYKTVVKTAAFGSYDILHLELKLVVNLSQ